MFLNAFEKASNLIVQIYYNEQQKVFLNLNLYYLNDVNDLLKFY